jgi:hypothetical protein
MTAYIETQISELRAELGTKKYRNRAAERRKMYGQPSHVKLPPRHAPYPTKPEKPKNMPPAWYYKEHFEQT